MTWVKVCGLRTRLDVAAAIEAGADAIGLVMHQASPRHISPVTARDLVQDADGVCVVAVTRDARPDMVLSWVAGSGATAVQPHGHHQIEVAMAAERAGLQVIMPLSPPDDLPVQIGGSWMPMLDNIEPGSGQTLDWHMIDGTRLGDRWILAGGLTPANVGAAIEATGAWGVDASSGLESTPGVKDPSRIRAFVRAAKESRP